MSVKSAITKLDEIVNDRKCGGHVRIEWLREILVALGKDIETALDATPDWVRNFEERIDSLECLADKGDDEPLYTRHEAHIELERRIAELEQKTEDNHDRITYHFTQTGLHSFGDSKVDVVCPETLTGIRLVCKYDGKDCPFQLAACEFCKRKPTQEKQAEPCKHEWIDLTAKHPFCKKCYCEKPSAKVEQITISRAVAEEWIARPFRDLDDGKLWNELKKALGQ